MNKTNRTQPVKGSLLLIVTDNRDGNLDDGTQVLGPFDSREAAVEWIRKEAKNTFEPNQVDEAGRCEDWGSFHILVEVRDVLIPVPTVRVSMAVETTELPPFGTVGPEDEE